MKRVLIMGAAGRDFHNFNVLFRDDERYRVVAFTAAQIPDIEGRDNDRFPPLTIRGGPLRGRESTSPQPGGLLSVRPPLLRFSV